MRESNKRRVQELQTEIQVLQDALSKAATAESSGGKTSRRRRLELEKRSNDESSSFDSISETKKTGKEGVGIRGFAADM